ncbi:hypothetical protein JHW43_000710 [Diplocarpon mali]|nr:hypothetical protein JHW43_000710 [Diplocarpon mali]
MLFTFHLTLAAAFAVVSARPPKMADYGSAIPLTRIMKVDSMKRIVAKGKARLDTFNTISGMRMFLSGQITNDHISYVAPVLIAGHVRQLLVDTESSLIWCGAEVEFRPSSNAMNMRRRVPIKATTGSEIFSGRLLGEKVNLGNLTVPLQSVCQIKNLVGGYSGVDGTLGLGPAALTEKTNEMMETVSTLTMNLISDGSISTEVYGVYLKPDLGNGASEAAGELTVGHINTNRYTGELTYFNTPTFSPASRYWSLEIAEMTFGTTSLASSFTANIDTGTTLIHFPATAYSIFLTSAGGETDTDSGLAAFKTKPTANIDIKIGSTTYTLTPQQYLVPEALYEKLHLATGKHYAWIADSGKHEINSISATIGQKFLENYYSVYDTTNSRIGFAASA